MPIPSDPNSPADILSRVRFPDVGDLGPSEARYILQIGFSPADREKLQTLLSKNSAGEILPSEKEELDSFLAVSCFIDILHSKARLALKRTGHSGTAA